MLNQQILSTEIYIHTSPISYNNLSQMLDERFEYSLRVVLFPKFKFSLLSLSLSNKARNFNLYREIIEIFRPSSHRSHRSIDLERR